MKVLKENTMNARKSIKPPVALIVIFGLCLSEVICLEVRSGFL